MAQFNLSWDNTPIISNSNVVSQLASYRQKSVGGAFNTVGFSPGNPLAKSIVATTSPILSNNQVWEFKIESICTVGGPTINDNGIIENLDFACISPSLGSNVTSSTCTIDLTNTDITKVTFMLKKTSDNSLVYGPTLVVRSGSTASTTATGLTGGTSYYWQTYYYATINGLEVVSNTSQYINASCGDYTSITDLPPDLAFVPLAKACEKEGKFFAYKTITGLSSPLHMAYDSVTGRTYVADYDSTAGNVYWFNASTATSIADMTYSTAIIDPLLYNNYIDLPKRKIYFVGKNSGGLKVYDIDTNTVSTVAFGTDGTNFSRMVITVSGNNIYCNNNITQSIIIIDRNTLTVTSTIPISGIPNNTRFGIGGFTFIPVGSEIWVAAGSGSSVSGIGIYDASFTANITNITFSGAAFWDSLKYWGGVYYDTTSGHVYANDIGSNQRFVIDASSKIILNQRTSDNRQGKTNTIYNWSTDPVTNELYTSHISQNNSGDASIVRTYVEDRTTYQYKSIYNGIAVPDLVRIGNTTQTMSSYAGLPSWAGGAWATDGTITFFDSAVSGDNTGVQIVLTLQQIDHNNSDLPTGVVKDNVMGDPDYVAPVTNLTDCPITYALTCPTDIVKTYESPNYVWEFKLPSATYKNPAIAKMRVSIIIVAGGSTQGTPVVYTAPLTAYYHHSEAAPSNTYTIKVEYLDLSDVVLATC